MRKLLAGIMVTIVAWTGTAQESEPLQFSLDQAIEYALSHNYGAINADRGLEDAQKQKWETIASGLPQIDGAIGYQNQLKQPVSLIPAEIFGGEPGTFAEVAFGQPQQASASATLRQQIFDGSYIVGVQATKAFLRYSANNKEKTDLDVRKEVIEAYGNVLLSLETVALLEKDKANLEKNLFETQKIYENGLGDEESVEQLQITLYSVENEYKNAVRYELITLQMLNLVMGLPIDSPTQLTDRLDDLTQQQIDPELVGTGLVMENNVDYKLALNLNDQRYFEWKLARSKALPRLNAFLNYGANAYSDNFDFLGSNTKWFDSSVLGVELNIPIFSSLMRSAGTQRAKIALEQAKTQLTETEERVRLALERAKSDYILAIEQYDTSKKNLALAERIENKNQVKYFEGLASSFDLRQAQTQLYSAQREYLQSMVSVINTKADLEAILNE